MRLSFLDAFSKNKSTPTPGPSPRHTEPASGRDTTTNRSRRHGPGHSLQSPRIDVHQTSPTVEGASTGLPPMKPALDLWVTKSQRKLSDLAEMQAIHAIAQVSAADNPFWLRTVPAYIQTCIRETDPIRQPGQRTQLERQAAALNRVSNHIQLLTIVLSQDTEHGQAMAQRLLQWTLAELLDALGDPHMSADLMVLGLREGLSAAELIGMHRAGLTAQTVRQVRKAHELAGNPAPSLREMAIHAPPETVGTQALTWGLTHGFKPAEVPALLSAGWGSHTDAPPAPDEASRRLGALVPTQRSSRDGWTELTDPHAENPSAPYWFKPCTCSSQDEQRLRKGLFVQALAELLGLPQRTLPVHAHVRSHLGEPVYGVLIGPVPALRENARPPRSPDPDGLRLQEIEASWLAWLGDAEWRDQDRHWTNSRQDPQLCLGLPVATSDADTSDETPPRFLSMGHPKLIPVNLKQRMEALSVDALAPALAWLHPADRSAAEKRWQQMDINRAIVLPPPQRDLTRARRITQLTTAQSGLTPARSARLPRTWLQRLAPLQVAEDALLMAAASRLDTVEGFDADQAKKPPTPTVSRLITWGQLQRARAHLAQHLMAWDPTTVPPADRADARRERQRLLDRLQGMPTSARHLSTRSVEKIRKAGADDDQLTALTSTLKTYAHLMHQPLPADDTALLQLQTLGEWARRLVSSVDKQVAALQQASDQPVPKELEQLRRALKTDLRLLSDAVVIAHELQAAPVDRPAMPVSPAELMALAGLTAITPAQRQAAWQAGATVADLIRVHSAEPPAGLPPTWALLADSLLQARAVQLVEEQNTLRPLDAQAVATMRRRLQTVYPLSEVAAMAGLAMTTADARADAPDRLDTSDPSSAPKGRLPLAGSRVLRALGWGVELSDAENSPQAQALDKAIKAYDKAHRSLESLPLDSPGLGTAAADAAQRLDDLHTALIATGSLNASSGLAGALIEEAAALKRLPTIAERLVTARPSSGSADALSPADTADQLLQLLSPSGPDERRLLHGRLSDSNGSSSSPPSTPDSTPRQPIERKKLFSLNQSEQKFRSPGALLSPRQTPNSVPSPTDAGPMSPRKKLVPTLNFSTPPSGVPQDVQSPRGFFSPRRTPASTPYKAPGSRHQPERLESPPPFSLADSATEEAAAEQVRQEAHQNSAQRRIETATRDAFPHHASIRRDITFKDSQDQTAFRLSEQAAHGHVVLDFPHLPHAGDVRKQLNKYVRLTRVDLCPDQQPHKTAKEAGKVLAGLIGLLTDSLSVQEKKAPTLQQPHVAQALRSLLDQLQEEQRLLAPLCKSARIKELRSLGVEIPTDSRLVEMMATSELKKDLFNAWTDAGLDVRDLARGGLGDLALEDLDSAVPGGLSSPGAVAGARHVLAARMSFPHMDKARFLALAPVLLERQVPLELLQCMADWAIEPNPDNLPAASDLLQATECDLKPLGKGNMGTAYKLQLGSQWWVFKAEQEGGPGDAAQADIPARGANTTGRVLAAARMARLLQLDTIPEARPFWVPPRDGMPGRYGSVSRLVTGSMLQAGAGDVAVYPLDNDFKVMGARKQMPQIKDRARQHGFEDVHLDENKRQLVFKPRTEYLRPLDHASLALRRSLAEANVTELITGQVDGNPGNYLLENGQLARLIDTAESFLPHLSHPLGQITKPAPVIQEWETYLQAMVSAVSRKQPLPKTPGSVGMVQRLELLRLSEGEFVQRWARELSQGDQQMAWLAMQSLKAQLNNKDGITSVPDRVAIDGNTAVHCHGWPPAVASDLKAGVLALTEGSVAQALAPFLKPEEVQSTWSRTVALQNMLQVPGAIHEVRSDDEWLSAEVTQRMGWTPSALKTAQEKLDGAPGDDWDKRAFRRDLLMNSGLPGALALEEHRMRDAIARSTPDAPYQGTALFDPKSLLEGMNLA